jgi:hypothetical protein
MLVFSIKFSFNRCILFLSESDVECSRISEGRLSDSESAAEENTIRGRYLHTLTLSQQTQLHLTIFISSVADPNPDLDSSDPSEVWIRIRLQIVLSLCKKSDFL